MVWAPLAAGVYGLLVADTAAIPGFKAAKHECRKHGEDSEQEERPVNAVDHRVRMQAGRRRDKDGRSETGDGYAEADGKLLSSACNGTGHAGILVRDISVGEGVHARV